MGVVKVRVRVSEAIRIAIVTDYLSHMCVQCS